MTLMTDTEAADAITASLKWVDAVGDLIRYVTDTEQPFSSGELAATIRTHRPDLRFSATTLGDYVRDIFYQGEISYNGNPAVMVPRETQGLGRTPSGQRVFVYAPDTQTGLDHAFEVDIPPPPGSTPKAGIQGVPSQQIDLRATVHIDERLCIPRSVLEELVHSAGLFLSYGENVYVRFPDPDTAEVSLFPNGGTPYEVTRRGRVLFPRPNTPLSPGSVYPVEIKGKDLIVDLRTDLKVTIGGPRG